MGRRAYALFVAVANLLSHLSAFQNAYVCPHNCTTPSSQMKCLKCPKNTSKLCMIVAEHDQYRAALELVHGGITVVKPTRRGLWLSDRFAP